MLFATLSCSKDDSNETPSTGDDNAIISETGITEEDFERYQGQLGISISAREIAKMGATPTSAIITSENSTISINETIDIDPDLSVAQLYFEVENLTEEEQSTLSSGVPLNVSIRDENNLEIGNTQFPIIIFKNNPENIEVEALETLDDIRDDLTFTAGTNYFIQVKKVSNDNGQSAMFVNYQGGSDLEVNVQQFDNYDFDSQGTDAKLFQFRLFEIPSQPGVFAISANVTGNDPLLIKIFQNYLLHEDSINPEEFNLDNLDDNTKFTLRRAENGYYTLQTLASNIPLRKRIIDNKTRFNDIGDPNDELLYVRILSTDIAWDTQEIDGTIYLDPILPGATTEISYNSKLSNCAAGVITERVGNEESVTQENSTSIEESISMTSSQTSSITASISTTIEASYFGVGASVSAGLSSTLEQQKSITQTSTQASSNTETNELSVFSERDITIPSGTAAIVNDTYQSYASIKVPFIKQFIIQGEDALTNQALTGQEIATQYIISTGNGSGVITEIGNFNIKVTVRGIATRAQEIRKTTRADDADPECN